MADPGGGGGQDPPPFVPRCRLFNIGPKIGPPSGPPFLLVDLIWTPPLSKILDPPLPPKSVTGVRNYYRRFIPNYGKIANPLYKLTGLDSPWQWTEKEQTAFETLRSALTSQTMLVYPDFEKSFTLTTDASGVGVGVCLS